MGAIRVVAPAEALGQDRLSIHADLANAAPVFACGALRLGVGAHLVEGIDGLGGISCSGSEGDAAKRTPHKGLPGTHKKGATAQMIAHNAVLQHIVLQKPLGKLPRLIARFVRGLATLFERLLSPYFLHSAPTHRVDAVARSYLETPPETHCERAQGLRLG